MQINEQIIEACRLKNREAQKQLYQLLLPYLRAVAFRYLRDGSYTKDVLQESFVKIFSNIDKYDSGKAPIKKWATRIVINLALNYNKRIIGIPDDEFNNDIHEVICFPQALKEFTEEHLLSILKQMPSSYFDVFNLFIIEEYKHEEIAAMLQISPSLSRKRLSRARDWIKKTFKKNPNMKSDLISFYNNTIN